MGTINLLADRVVDPKPPQQLVPDRNGDIARFQALRENTTAFRQ
jgi:hypothetical protein